MPRLFLASIAPHIISYFTYYREKQAHRQASNKSLEEHEVFMASFDKLLKVWSVLNEMPRTTIFVDLNLSVLVIEFLLDQRQKLPFHESTIIHSKLI